MTGPLSGSRIVVTRPATQAERLVSALSERGAQVVVAPLIEIRPPSAFDRLDDSLSDLDRFEWVLFASTNAVTAVFARLEALGLDAGSLRRRRIGAVGTATAAALRAHGLACDACPSGGTGSALVAAVGRGTGEVLFPRAEDAPRDPIERLSEAGWTVREVAAYRTVAVRPPDDAAEVLARARYDAVVFASPSAVRAYAELLGSELPHLTYRRPHPPIVSIGPSTSQAIRELGLEVAAEAQPHNDDGMVDALVSMLGSEVRR